MNAFLSIASREVTTRGRVLAASFAIGLIPLAVPFVVTSGSSPAEIRGISAWFAGLMIGLGVAVLTGSALFGAPLAEGRASFWLSRPASTTAIWAGKLAGAVALVVLSTAVALLPGTVARTGPSDPVSWRALLALLALEVSICLVALLVATAASVAIRSRSAWIAVDLLLLATVVTLAWKALENVAWVGGLDPSLFWADSGATARLWIGAIEVPVVACLGFSTWAAVAVGRGDIRLAHRAQSLALWTPLVSFASIAFGASLWYAFPPLSALKVEWVEPAGASGTWVVATGHADLRPGATFRFLVDSASGRSLRLDRGLAADVSADGSRAAFMRPTSLRSRELQLVCVDSRSPRFSESVVPGSFSWSRAWTEISSDGSRLARVADGNLSLLELPSGRLLGSAALPKEAGPLPRPIFRGASILLLPHESWEQGRVAAEGPVRAISIWVFDPAARRLSPALPLEVTPAPAGARFLPSADRRLVLARRPAESRLPIDVIETATGRRIFSVVPGEGARITASGFLSDGTVVGVESSEKETRLRVFAPDGTEKTAIAVPGGRVRFQPGGEIRPGLMAAGIARTDASGEKIQDGHRLALVDFRSGTVLETGERAHPLFDLGWLDFQAGMIPDAGSAVTRLFQRDDVLLTGIPGEGPLVPLPLR